MCFFSINSRFFLTGKLHTHPTDLRTGISVKWPSTYSKRNWQENGEINSWIWLSNIIIWQLNQ